MYVCQYVCMYVCMYACMGWLDCSTTVTWAVTWFLTSNLILLNYIAVVENKAYTYSNAYYI